MTITATKLYQLLSDKTDKETAEVLTNYIQEKIKEDMTERVLQLATTDFVKTVVAEAKISMVKWMFGFWFTQMLALAGIAYMILLQVKK